MNKNQVKKDLYKSKEIATLSRYVSGNLYYQVKVGFDIFEFPIPTTEKCAMDGSMSLSHDLGTTSFGDKMKGSDLNRWIGKAIDNDEFIMIGTSVSPV